MTSRNCATAYCCLASRNSVSTGNQIWSSPAVANGVVYVGSDDFKLYAFNAASGQLLWSAAAGGQINTSPAVANGIVYIGSDKLYAFGLRPADSLARPNPTTSMRPEVCLTIKPEEEIGNSWRQRPSPDRQSRAHAPRRLWSDTQNIANRSSVVRTLSFSGQEAQVFLLLACCIQEDRRFAPRPSFAMRSARWARQGFDPVD